jgi:chemotaxis protein MotB
MGSIMKLRGLVPCALAVALLGASCASTQYQGALDEREAENRALREERTDLKGKVIDLSNTNASLETALAEANARFLETPDSEGLRGDAELDGYGIGVGVRDGNVVYTVPSEITFASGKADLSSKGKQALGAVAQRLKSEYPDNEFWVEGHTDSDPISKSKFASNRELSLQRAMAVLRYLVDEADVKDGQCVVAGWGEYRPVAGNGTATEKARNRRVEIIVRRP